MSDEKKKSSKDKKHQLNLTKKVGAQPLKTQAIHEKPLNICICTFLRPQCSNLISFILWQEIRKLRNWQLSINDTDILAMRSTKFKRSFIEINILLKVDPGSPENGYDLPIKNQAAKLTENG